MARLTPFAVVALFAVAPTASAQVPAPTSVTVTAQDGVKLKATYYSAGKPGPAVMLMHQCNSNRESWASLARAAAARGYHVLAMDYRGFGESEGQRFESFQEQQPVIAEKWPGDIDAAFMWLTSQQGVDRQRVAAAGASCGVNQAVLLAARHPEVKTVLLLSGGLSPAAREHLRKTPSMPIFASASHGDGDAVNSMRWLLGWSGNPANQFLEYKAAGHGTEMFAVEKDLEPAMLRWLDTQLRNASPSASANATPSASARALAEFWDVLARPDGKSRARAIIEETKRRDPRAVLFPEGELNAYAYQILQGGDAEHALWLFELNVEAHPKSANTYDSLSDAYLAAGKKAEALRYAEKALQVLETDTSGSDEFRALVRESAEKKVRELRGK